MKSQLKRFLKGHCHPLGAPLGGLITICKAAGVCSIDFQFEHRTRRLVLGLRPSATDSLKFETKNQKPKTKKPCTTTSRLSVLVLCFKRFHQYGNAGSCHMTKSTTTTWRTRRLSCPIQAAEPEYESVSVDGIFTHDASIADLHRAVWIPSTL